MSHADVLPAASGRRRRWHLGLPLLIAALAVCVLPGAAEAKKKRDKIGVATYNLYLGSDLGDATRAAQNARTDQFANEVGAVLQDVLTNDFATRSKAIAKDIRKRKVDLVGLQEAALWKLQTPTDGSGLNPSAQRALNPVVDYIDELLRALNRKAMSRRECERKDIPKSKCYRGYEVVVAQEEADLEFLGDFDNNMGPNGTSCDLSSGACAPPPSNDWALGNDDTGVNLGEPAPVRQCADGIDNDGDTNVDWPADAECSGNLDGVEALAGFQNTAAFPQDANFDSHALATTPNLPSPDGPGVGRDPAGIGDCVSAVGDNNPSSNSGGPFAGTAWAATNQPVCLFHGIDGDLSLTMRDAIIKRKGAGVTTSNPRSNNFANILSLPLFGGQASVKFTRGWTAADAKVRGTKFTFVNTHLESESVGSIREDQASELVAPGGPATEPTTVLVGDLNSDPNRAATNLPNGDGGSNIAINRLFAAGFSMLTPSDLATGSHGDHGDVINDPNDLLGEGFIDHVLTNDPNAIKRKGNVRILDGFEGGLWQSDHAGVLVRISGKKR